MDLQGKIKTLSEERNLLTISPSVASPSVSITSAALCPVCTVEQLIVMYT